MASQFGAIVWGCHTSVSVCGKLAEIVRVPADMLVGEENGGYYLLSYRSEHPTGKAGFQKVQVTSTNPEFFRGTVVERAAAEVIAS